FKQKEKAADCGCIFASLVSTYNAIGLNFCGEEKWRNTNRPLAAKRIRLFYKFFSDLANLNLENQTPCLDNTNNNDLSINTTNLIVKLDRIKQFVDLVQLENQQKSKLIMDLNGQIEEIQKFIYDQRIEIEELRGKLDNQENEIEELRSRLQRAYDNIAKSQDLCDENIKHNEMLVEQ
ncbi:45708_t:CDS:2, partial [Gigaspora margarita]